MGSDFITLSYEMIASSNVFKSAIGRVQKVPRGKNLGLDVSKIEKKLGYKMPTSNKSIINLLKEYQ